jgi:phage/plasmid-like protein (TIGR03299 family)
MAPITKADVEQAQQDFADWQQNRGDKAEYAGSTRDPGVVGFRYTTGRGLPWHGSGTGYETDATPAEIVAQSFPWGDSVEKRPIFYRAKDGRRIKIPGKFATIRPDTEQALGLVGSTYVVQPITPFVESMYDVIDLSHNEARIDTAGALKGGAIPFISIALDGLDLTIAGEKFEGFLLGTTSFDGSRRMRLDPVILRPVCTNSVNLAPKGVPALGIPPAPTGFAMKHTALLSEKMRQARTALEVGFAYGEYWKLIGDKLALATVVESQVEAIFEKAFPIEGKSEARREASVAMQMLRDWRESDNLEPIRETAWGAFQAGVEWIDHLREYGKRGNEADARSYSLMYGDAAQLKTRLLSTVVEFAK